MKHYDTLTIGHISLDYNIDHLDQLVIECGGAVLYSSAAAYALGHKVAAVTKLAPEDKDRLSQLVLPEEDIKKANHWLVLFGRYVCKAQS